MEFIKGYEKIVNIYGKWPRFHDSEVHSINLSRTLESQGYGASIEVVIHVFEMTNKTDSKGNFILQKHNLVTLRFTESEHVVIEDFNHQNALNEIIITKQDDTDSLSSKFEVLFSPANGGYMSFNCDSIEVMNVETYSSETI